MHTASILGVALVMVGLVADADAKAGAVVLPPMRMEAGAAFPIVGGEAVEPGSEMLIGAHWSALTWRPTKFDIGIGYIGSKRPLVRGLRGSLARGTQPSPIAESFALNGGYLSLGKTFVNQPHFRTWLEVRGELLKSSESSRENLSVYGGAVRFAAEIYSSGVGTVSDHKSFGAFAGTFSIGVYVEASHRDIPLELGPTSVAGGISIRIPFLIGAAGC